MRPPVIHIHFRKLLTIYLYCEVWNFSWSFIVLIIATSKAWLPAIASKMHFHNCRHHHCMLISYSYELNIGDKTLYPSINYMNAGKCISSSAQWPALSTYRFLSASTATRCSPLPSELLISELWYSRPWFLQFTTFPNAQHLGCQLLLRWCSLLDWLAC